MGKAAAPSKQEYIVTHEESERIRILKIWLTVMVVLIHSHTEEIHLTGNEIIFQVPLWLDWMKYVLSLVISRCAVPGFFFLSALFLYRKEFSWWKNIRKKFRTILIPYILLNTIWILIFYAAQQFSFTKVYFTQEENIISHWTWRQWLAAYTAMGGQSDSPFVTPLWFLRDLMILNLFAPLIKKAIDKAPGIVFAGILIIVSINSIRIHIRNGSVFFFLGYYFVKYRIHITDVDKLNPRFLTAAYVISIAADCMMRDHPLQCFPRIVSIVLGLMFFTRFTTKISSERWHRRLLWAARFSLPVYLFHELSLTMLKKIAARILPMNAAVQAVTYLGLPVIVILLCTAASMFMDRFMPKLYSFFTGGRKL